MTRKIEWIEIARTGCMLLVVLGHVLDIFIFHGGEATHPWELAFLCFSRFAVPLFFIISGFLLRIEFDRSRSRSGMARFSGTRSPRSWRRFLSGMRFTWSLPGCSWAGPCSRGARCLLF